MTSKLVFDGDLINYLTTKALLKNVQKPVCFDIGAFEGVWGECILLEKPDATIYFFEPNPENFKKLSKNIENFSKNSKFFQTAISDVNGELVFNLHGSDSNSREYTENSMKVSCKKIDSFFASINKVDIVKIDTEGHDIHVLKTLLPFAAQGRIDAIVTEFTVYWYGSCLEEIMGTVKETLEQYFQIYKYCYALSRNGEPYLLGPIGTHNLTNFIKYHNMYHIQTDLYFMNVIPEGIKIHNFEIVY